MPIYQCKKCGRAENTANSDCGHPLITKDLLDWTGLEELKGHRLCSDCQPKIFKSGHPTKVRKWPGNKIYLPKDMFVTNAHGNLMQKDTEEGIDQYILKEEEVIENPILLKGDVDYFHIKRCRWFISVNNKIILQRGFYSKEEASKWINSLKEFDARCGYLFWLRGDRSEYKIVNRQGEEARA